GGATPRTAPACGGAGLKIAPSERTLLSTTYDFGGTIAHVTVKSVNYWARFYAIRLLWAVLGSYGMTRYRVGVDIGGTFTDIVFLGETGTVAAMKLASTPDDYSKAVLDGIRRGIDELGISPAAISELSHGFTIATNAILEENGARTALITTEGFRDVLE